MTKKEHKELQCVKDNYTRQKLEKEKFNEYRLQKEEDGKEFQKFVEKLFKEILLWDITCYKTRGEQFEIGENKAGVEIKWDEITETSKNVYIEYAEKARIRGGLYAFGGILKNDNSWLYVVGDKTRIFVFDINILRCIYKENRKKKKYSWIENRTKTSLGFLMPKKDARKICLFLLIKQKGVWKKIVNKKKITQKDIYKL